MPPTNRDPRSGDIWATETHERAVIAVHDGLVRYCPKTNGEFAPINDMRITIRSWRKWAKDAEVLHAAE